MNETGAVVVIRKVDVRKCIDVLQKYKAELLVTDESY